MKANVSIESLRGPLGEFLLINVSGGDGIIGICDTTVRKGTERKTFFVGSESIINIFNNGKNPESNRQIWQTSTIEKCKQYIGNLFPTCCDAYFLDGVSFFKAIMPILELLTPGLYVAHIDKAYPTDGSGNYFWNAYAVKHELNGSAERIPIVDDKRDYSPMFLVPTKNFSDYSDKKIDSAITKLRKGKHLGGIAYHLSGMFSALLYGHTNATACLQEGMDFNCIIIEPLNKVIVDRNDGPTKGRVVAVSCPFVKIPFVDLSPKMTENFLLSRKDVNIQDYDIIKSRADKMISGTSYVKRLPNELLTSVEALPDADMMISAHAVSELTDEHLAALLSGQTKIDGEVIISTNYYESIVYACNYLQYTDKSRFIDFVKSILENPDLVATYSYVAGRIKYIMDARINEIFKNIAESENTDYESVKAIAEAYLKTFAEYTEKNVNKFLSGDATFEDTMFDNDDSEPDTYHTSGSNNDRSFSSLAIAKQVIKK